MLCTTNIVFGGDNNHFPDKFVVQVITTITNNNQSFMRNIDEQGQLATSIPLNEPFQPTHTGKLDIESNRLTLSYTNTQSQACTNSPITIPDKQLQAMLNNNQETRHAKQEIVIQNLRSLQLIQVELNNESLSSYLKKPTDVVFTQKNQKNNLPKIATKENPIFHIVSQGIFYKVNNNFTLDNADYYLSGQSCKKTLLLDPSQEISNPIEHDEVLIPLGILKRLQQELIKQDKIDLYVNEGNNDEIKIITIKQPVKEPIQQPAPKAFFAAYPRLTILLISIGITGLAYLTVCFIARAWNKTTSTYYINASLY